MHGLLILLIFPVISADLCKKCTCGMGLYFNQRMYITNCTFVGISNDNLNLLAYLPEETEVLIFKGNNVPVLPANIFGTDKNLTKLKIIDMSDNRIEEIKGKTFHHVPMVERLILDHNSITLTGNSHPRMFSNFENLLELHLTDAFLDYKDADLAEELHTIFINSNLTKLIKLHLEQNEIVGFADTRVFCDLISLMDLHLSDNNLQELNFVLTCLPHFRYLNLERNKIQRFNHDDILQFDSIASHHQFTLNIDNNPFICDCNPNNLYNWLQNTDVLVKHNETLKCNFTKDKMVIFVKDFISKDCPSVVQSYEEIHPIVHYFTYVVFLVVLVLVIYLIFLSIKYTSEYCRNPVTSVGKVQYVVIRNPDDNKEVHMPLNKINLHL